MSNFSWVKIYKEIAEKIKDNDKDLIALLKGCESCQINYLKDRLLGNIWEKCDKEI